ncbi:hypothetical protein KSP40_PGU020391 [Platanthera guangdongensis]|uniref:Uncharacterized protein n=1 Tax=Platanthera guangdongensis TaxID=2320717 RepID=A0ABR2LDZ9_9ASPA
MAPSIHSFFETTSIISPLRSWPLPATTPFLSRSSMFLATLSTTPNLPAAPPLSFFPALPTPFQPFPPLPTLSIPMPQSQTPTPIPAGYPSPPSAPARNPAPPPPPRQQPTPSSFCFPRRHGKKGGIWSWKPLGALSHIRMDRLSTLVSVEVVAIQFLPGSMNGLRLSGCVRKKKIKEGAVQTMPAIVFHGAADFEETLFIRCHVYFSGGGDGRTDKPIPFEPRPTTYELNFKQSYVDLSWLVKESVEKSLEGSRQASEISSESSSSFARRQSKSSFSISSPKATRQSASPSQEDDSTVELKAIEEFNLDEDPAPAPFLPHTSQAEMEDIADELDPP